MGRHDQKPKDGLMVCPECRKGNCVSCVDALLFIARGEGREYCKCKRKGHNGEPRDQQILDPETGTVHAPGLTISKDGEVTRYMQEVEESKRAFDKGWDEASGMNE